MRSGVNHSTISRLIQGDRTPSLTTAIAILRVLAAPAHSGELGEPSVGPGDATDRAA
jgi:transcriptional regulator with XRE-family HTH domain